MAKEATVSNDGKTITFYVITEIAPDRTVYNWNTGNYELRESVTSQRYFAEKLTGATAEQTVELYINSMGGDVKEALGIVNVLKRCPAKVVAYVDGFAASAASVITQGADEVWMPKNTCMMLHNARWITEGNPKELRKSADDLEVINQTIINSYAIRAGDKLSAQKLQEILDAETWLTAEECVQYGLADGIASYDADIGAAAEQFKAAASAGAAAYVTAPPSIAALVTVPGGGGNGLPHQSADWFAMTDTGDGSQKGRIATPACELVRNDRKNCDPPAGAPENHRSRPGIRLLNALEKMEVRK